MTCANSYKNWWMGVKAIASQTWDIFGDTGCFEKLREFNKYNDRQ